MRSSLCALNAATGDNLTMNYPDYEQVIEKEMILWKVLRNHNLYYQFHSLVLITEDYWF